jgi:hypothetical protein
MFSYQQENPQDSVLSTWTTHSPHSKQPSRSFTHTMKSSVHLVVDILASTFPNNTLLFTSSIKFKSLVLLVGYVHQSWNPTTLPLSNGLGVVQTATKLWGRCCLPMSSLTSSFELSQISSSMRCSLPYATSQTYHTPWQR